MPRRAGPRPGSESGSKAPMRPRSLPGLCSHPDTTNTRLVPVKTASTLALVGSEAGREGLRVGDRHERLTTRTVVRAQRSRAHVGDAQGHVDVGQTGGVHPETLVVA